MKTVVLSNYEAVSQYAAQKIIAGLLENPKVVLGLATGSTPIGVYQQIINQYRAEELDFSNVTTFNLDEYYPIAGTHPQSYRYFMQENLFDALNVKPEQIHLPNGEASDVEEECKRYEAAIEAAGGIDIQILGIGENGHIAFNEPGTPFGSLTHLVNLTENTLQVNSRFFNDISEMPKHALTMGIKSIMQSKKILLLATGERKAEVLAQAINGPVTEQLPASVLQLHPDVEFVIDEQAASKLK